MTSSVRPRLSRALGRPHRPSSLALGLAAAFAAHAQTAPAPSAAAAESPELVVVTGLRASTRKALQAQQAADRIVSVVSADDIGSLPDKNAAEALARVPGVSLQRDQGEGRYVTVRGIGADLNAVTINGLDVPSPEASRRGVALDVLPAGMIRSLEVAKTFSAENDSHAVGAAIDVKTLSAFDLKGRLLTLGASVGHDSLSGHNNPGASLLWADRYLDGTLGVALGASAEKRRFASDDVETGGAWNSQGQLSGFEQRDYQPQRERAALALNLDYRPGDAQRYHLRSFVGQFSDDEVRDRLTVGNFNTASGSAAQDQSVTARAERRLRQRKYTQTIGALSLGLERPLGDWTLQADLGRSQASEDTPESINDARFRYSNVAGVSYSGTALPQLSGPESLYDPARYALNSITLQARDSRDKLSQARLDLLRDLTLASVPTELQLGAKLSRRDKRNDTEQWAYNSSSTSSARYWGAGGTTLSSFVGNEVVDFAPGRIGLAIDPALVRARVANLGRDGARLTRESTINDYRLREDSDAAYAQATLRPASSAVLIVGLRGEQGRFVAQGSQVAADNTVQPVTREHRDSHWLPSLQARWDLGHHSTLRAGVSRSVVRANFAQLAPGVNLTSSTEATIGNPDLKPLRAVNLDLGIEHLLGQDGAASVYLFDKRLRDYSYTTNLAGSGAWAGYTSAQSYANGDQASVRGLELSYQQALRQLPAPFNGLLVGTNATFTQSSADIARYDSASAGQKSRRIPLPGQSKQVFNLMLGYEAGPLSTRLAWQHQSRYLLELGSDILDSQQDRTVAAQQQLDLSLAWQLSRAVQLVAEAQNLLRQRYYVYQGQPSFNVQNEQCGRSLKLGVKVAVF